MLPNMITVALVWSCRVVSKFHYMDPKTLSATRPDPRSKSVHVEIERTGLWPDKVRRLVGDPGLRQSPVGSLWWNLAFSYLLMSFLLHLYAVTLKRYGIGCKLVLIINRKSHMGFRLVLKSVTLNTLNGVIALILHYFTKFDRFESRLSQWLKIDL